MLGQDAPALRERRGRLTGVAALTAGLALLIGVPAAGATDFHVNATGDPGDGRCDATECTLREAVDTSDGLADRVMVPAGVYTLTQGPLLPADDTIIGAGARTTIIAGGGISKVLYVTGG